MREEGEFFKFIWFRLHVMVGLWTTNMYTEHIIADRLAEEREHDKIQKRLQKRENVYGGQRARAPARTSLTWLDDELLRVSDHVHHVHK